jgi:hypothetical protein
LKKKRRVDNEEESKGKNKTPARPMRRCFAILCNMKGTVISFPHSAPKPGEKYCHYKGDHYEVVLLALHSNDDEWMVIYKPLYENPDAPYFTRPLREWDESVEWCGQLMRRFVHID